MTALEPVPNPDDQLFGPLPAATSTNGAVPLDPATTPYTGYSHDEVLALEVGLERHLIQDLIPIGAVGTIAGVPETHKSWLAQQVAVTIAKGQGQVLGCPVATQCNVGYFWQDDSTREEVERIKTYEHANQAAGSPLRWFLNENVQLPADTARIHATITLHQLGLVVLDSFYNFLPGIDLKDDQAERIVAQLKREIADTTGCTILIVDHMPWATETNRQRLRAYGGVFKNAATRFGIYIDAQNKNLSIEARGNNIKGFRKHPAYWDDERLELHLIDSDPEARTEQETDAYDWIINHVTQHYHDTGAGISRGRVEEAYHQAHGGRGRNLARRIIDREIVAYRDYETALIADPTADIERRITNSLATCPGESPRGTYLKPFTHADSPLAAHPNGETGEYPNAGPASTHSPHSPLPYKGADESAANGRDHSEPTKNDAIQW